METTNKKLCLVNGKNENSLESTNLIRLQSNIFNHSNRIEEESIVNETHAERQTDIRREEIIPTYLKKNKKPKKFSLAELNDLVRGLGLSKVYAEYLVLTLDKKNLIEKEAAFFTSQDDRFKNISNGEPELSLDYTAEEKQLLNSCMNYCCKCDIYIRGEETRLNCRICSSSLIYWCNSCKKYFCNFQLMKNHKLNKISTTTKCSQCFRSYFSTICSLQSHEQSCNLPFTYDKEIRVKLEKYISSELECFNGKIFILKV